MTLAVQAAQRLFVLGGHVKKVCPAHLSTHTPRIAVSKVSALIDEKIQIVVHGLVPAQKVTLQAFLKEDDKTFGACGHYIADSEGNVDTFRDQSYGGTFEGVEPMGLFWSMKTTPGVKPGRLVKANVMVPYDVTVAVQDGFQEFKDLSWTADSTSLASCHLQRTYAAPGVKRISVNENGLYGTLFLPAGEGPFPAVIDLFGLTGEIKEFRSALLASHGFASLTVVYCEYKDLPEDTSTLDFRYFLKAFDWLAAHPLVDAAALGGVSTCIAGGYLQFIAALRPAIKCIASINSTGIPPGPEQTVEGLYMKPLSFQYERCKIIEDKISFLDMWRPEDEVTVCPGWRHGAKFLSIQGLDDHCVNPDYLEVFKSQIPAEFRKNCTFIAYPGAGHLIEPPYAPLCRYNFHAVADMNIHWGGQPKPHAHAQEDSWPKILAFLKQNLSKSEYNSASFELLN